eukprot:COSAG01_NODE_659_length_14436_cov_15.108112_2_plen_74_part_00
MAWCQLVGASEKRAWSVRTALSSKGSTSDDNSEGGGDGDDDDRSAVGAGSSAADGFWVVAEDILSSQLARRLR